MKKNSWILACVLLFVSMAAFAQTPQSHPPLTQEALAAILGLPAASSCATQPSGVREATAKRPAIPAGKSTCGATASCGAGTTISCSSDSGTCTGVDRDCSVGEQGHVTCNGSTTQCPTACPSSCNGLSGTQYQCCQCDLNGGCVPCCRCSGENFASCLEQCG